MQSRLAQHLDQLGKPVQHAQIAQAVSSSAVCCTHVHNDLHFHGYLHISCVSGSLVSPRLSHDLELTAACMCGMHHASLQKVQMLLNLGHRFDACVSAEAESWDAARLSYG